jgi:hypothetical protein
VVQGEEEAVWNRMRLPAKWPGAKLKAKLHSSSSKNLLAVFPAVKIVAHMALRSLLPTFNECGIRRTLFQALLLYHIYGIMSDKIFRFHPRELIAFFIDKPAMWCNI